VNRADFDRNILRKPDGIAQEPYVLAFVDLPTRFGLHIIQTFYEQSSSYLYHGPYLN
jgi:hypothetical protein